MLLITLESFKAIILLYQLLAVCESDETKTTLLIAVAASRYWGLFVILSLIRTHLFRLLALPPRLHLHAGRAWLIKSRRRLKQEKCNKNLSSYAHVYPVFKCCRFIRNFAQFLPVGCARLNVFFLCTRVKVILIYIHPLCAWFTWRIFNDITRCNRAPFRTCQVCTSTPANHEQQKNVSKKNSEICSRAPASSVRAAPLKYFSHFTGVSIAQHSFSFDYTHPIWHRFAWLFMEREKPTIWAVWIRRQTRAGERVKKHKREWLQRRSSDLFMLVLKLKGTIVSPANLRFSRHTHTFWMSFFLALYSWIYFPLAFRSTFLMSFFSLFPRPPYFSIALFVVRTISNLTHSHTLILRVP